MSISIHSLQSSLYGFGANGVSRAQATQATQSTTSTKGSAASAAGGGSLQSAAISSFGQFLSKVQSLSKTDPSKAKGLLSDIADKLKTKASSAASSDAAQRLSAMADKFAQAAQTGDVSGLQPQQALSGGGGGSQLARMQAAYQQASGVDQSVMDVLSTETL